MTRQEAVNKVIEKRGLEDKYAILIARESENPEVTNKAIIRLMYDILLGVSYEEN
jgi:hypothetical protein